MSCGKKVESSEKTEETGTEAAVEDAEKELIKRKETEPEKMEQRRTGQPELSTSAPPEEEKTEGGKSRKELLLIPLFLLLAGLGVVFDIRIGSGLGSGGGSIKQDDSFTRRDTQERGKTAGTKSSESGVDSESVESNVENGSKGTKREEKLVLAAENTRLDTLQRKVAELSSMAAIA